MEPSRTPRGLETAEELLANLYELHDYYFTADKNEKKEMLKEASSKVLNELDVFGEGYNNRERARVAFIRGRTLDVFEDYNKEAETALTRAVKLEPDDIDAWNALGHCFWKKRDLPAARDCYTQALSKRVNKESLRSLSMVLRQLQAQTLEESAKNIQESILRAKDAIKLDPSDATSWYVLGNAYVTLFFKLTFDHEDLNKAMKAYHKAEASGGQNNPDLYFNKGNLLRYKEDFAGAAEAFGQAVDLDPSLPVGEALEDLAQRVHRTKDLLEKKGRMKDKKLNQLVSSLAEVKKADENHELVTLEELRLGDNKGKAVALKLILPVGGGQPPDTFIMADKTGRCTCLSVYHLDQEAARRFRDKDVFMVLDPHVKTVQYSTTTTTTGPKEAEGVQGDDKAGGPAPPDQDGLVLGSYQTLQVLSPSSLLINGRPLGGKHIQPPVIRLDSFDS